MRFRKLRIAWSVACGIAFLLLIVLWVRSYRVSDDWRRANGGKLLNIQSYRGEFGIGRWSFPRPIPWRHSANRIDEIDEPAKRLWTPMKDQAPLSYVGIRWQTLMPLNLFAIRYWSPVVLSGTLATLPWLSLWSGRYSLRTLLIATTLVAVVLGLIMWATR
jgi:hypothetical protein